MSNAREIAASLDAWGIDPTDQNDWEEWKEICDRGELAPTMLKQNDDENLGYTEHEIAAFAIDILIWIHNPDAMIPEEYNP